MCPLRVVLVFLSAILAGFFLVRSLGERAELNEEGGEEDGEQETANSLEDDEDPLPLFKKVGSAMRWGFWVCVDMASGRYLWRALVNGGGNSSIKKKKQLC